MKEALFILLGIVIAGIVILLCFSSCYLASKSDEYWEEIIRQLEKNKNARR